MNRRRFAARCLLVAAGAVRLSRARADEVETPESSKGHLNAVTPTLGGKQFWADELFFHDWHIQRNVFTDHCRLLDGRNLRLAWGTFDQCASKLDEIKQRRSIPPMHGAGVIVLHGLFRTASAMSRMSRYLRDEGGYSVFNVTYPTTRGAVADHARTLDKIIRSLEGIEELNFVAHSLGNLVVRHYLADQHRLGLRGDERIKRMVMLGPPNRGAQLAEALSGVGLFHAVAGASASQLARAWRELDGNLVTPEFEFGILAGGRGAERGYNPWLAGDNDLVVSVETTRLPGAADFAVLPVMHSLMMDSRTVQQYTLRFLQHGYFVSEEERRPIAPAAVLASREASEAPKDAGPSSPTG